MDFLVSQASLKRLNINGFSGFHSHPPAERGDLQTDAVVPALRVCGQLAKWTGNSADYQVRAGLTL